MKENSGKEKKAGKDKKAGMEKIAGEGKKSGKERKPNEEKKAGKEKNPRRDKVREGKESREGKNPGRKNNGKEQKSGKEKKAGKEKRAGKEKKLTHALKCHVFFLLAMMDNHFCFVFNLFSRCETHYNEFTINQQTLNSSFHCLFLIHQQAQTENQAVCRMCAACSMSSCWMSCEVKVSKSRPYQIRSTQTDSYNLRYTTLCKFNYTVS